MAQPANCGHPGLSCGGVVRIAAGTFQPRHPAQGIFLGIGYAGRSYPGWQLAVGAMDGPGSWAQCIQNALAGFDRGSIADRVVPGAASPPGAEISQARITYSDRHYPAIGDRGYFPGSDRDHACYRDVYPGRIDQPGHPMVLSRDQSLDDHL